jgi:hypothetical protein
MIKSYHMTTKYLSFVLAILVVVVITTDVYAIGMAKLTIKVVDEEGKPVESAKVEMCFHGGQDLEGSA